MKDFRFRVKFKMTLALLSSVVLSQTACKRTSDNSELQVSTSEVESPVDKKSSTANIVNPVTKEALLVDRKSPVVEQTPVPNIERIPDKENSAPPIEKPYVKPKNYNFTGVKSKLLRGGDKAEKLSVDVTGVKELYLTVHDADNGGGFDQTVWLSPKLFTTDGSEVDVTELKPQSISTGWGTMLLNKNYDNKTLNVGGVKYEKGLWVHGPSLVKIDLNGKYKRFEAYVGIDASAGTNGSAFFELSDKRLMEYDPMYPQVSENEMLKRYDAWYPRVEVKYNPENKYFVSDYLTDKKHWRETLGLKRVAGVIQGPEIVAKEPKTGQITDKELLEALSRIGGQAMQLRNEKELTEVRELLTDIGDLLVAATKSGKSSSRHWAINYDHFFNISAVIPHQIMTELGENKLNALYKDRHSKTPYSSMDWLRGHPKRLLPQLRLFSDPKVRTARIVEFARYWNRVFSSEVVLTSEGCPIHHNLLHYSYADYSLYSGYSAVRTCHNLGAFLSKKVYDKMFRAAALAYNLTGGSGNMHVPLNASARAGMTSGVWRGLPVWLSLAADLGDGKDPNTLNPQMISLLAKIHPNHRQVKRAKEMGLVYDKDPKRKHVTVNKGTLAVRMYGNTQVSASGTCDKFNSMTEMYMKWPECNVYNGMFITNGSILLRDVTDNGSSNMFFNGYNVSFIPGVTNDIRSEIDSTIAVSPAVVHNKGIGGGTDFQDNNTAIWGLENGLIYSATSKKSAFFFGDRITCLTSNIKSRNDQRRYYNMAAQAKPNSTYVTTLYQWPKGGGRTSYNNKTLSKFPYQIKGTPTKGVTIVDRHNHGYVVHPNKNAKLVLKGRNQKQTILNKKYLKKGMSGYIYRHTPTWSREDKPKIFAQYTPTSNDFDLAYFEHGLTDGSDDANCAYTILPSAGKEKAAKLLAAMKAGKAPYRILMQNGDAHVVRDHPTQTTGYVIFKNNSKLPQEGALMSCSSIAYIMVRDDSPEKKSISIFSSEIVCETKIKGAWSLAEIDAESLGYRIETKVVGGHTVIKTERLNGLISLRFQLIKK